MAIDANGEWDGVCACGKREADGIRCFLGATHQRLHRMPWESTSIPKTAAAPSFPWTQDTVQFPWNGKADGTDQ